MDGLQDRETGTCEVCGEPIEYWFIWKHTNGDQGKRHQAWPEKEKIELIEESPEASPVAWW